MHDARAAAPRRRRARRSARSTRPATGQRSWPPPPPERSGASPGPASAAASAVSVSLSRAISRRRLGSPGSSRLRERQRTRAAEVAAWPSRARARPASRSRAALGVQPARRLNSASPRRAPAPRSLQRRGQPRHHRRRPRRAEPLRMQRLRRAAGCGSSPPARRAAAGPRSARVGEVERQRPLAPPAPRRPRRQRRERRLVGADRPAERGHRLRRRWPPRSAAPALGDARRGRVDAAGRSPRRRRAGKAASDEEGGGRSGVSIRLCPVISRRLLDPHQREQRRRQVGQPPVAQPRAARPADQAPPAPGSACAPCAARRSRDRSSPRSCRGRR